MLCFPKFRRRRLGHWASGGTYFPTELAKAYGFPQVTVANPATVAILELGGGWQKNDVINSAAQMGIPTPVITDNSVGGAGNAPGNDADGEVALDQQVVAGAYSAMTGQAANIAMIWAPNTGQGFANGIAMTQQLGAKVLSISWGCYDNLTQVLTSGGWKYFSEVDGTELVATLNSQTGSLEYQGIQKVHKYRYAGKLHSYLGRCTDLVVTPNHNMYVGRFGKKAQLIQSQEIFGRGYYKVPKTASWSGREVKEVAVAGKPIDADVYLEFLGYFLSEGWASVGTVKHKEREFTRICSRLVERRRGSDGTFELSEPSDERELVEHEYVAKAFEETSYCVGISQVKEEGVRKIQECLSKLPFKFNRTKRGWKCSGRALCEELRIFGKAHEKYVPQWVKELSPRQLRIFYDALMVGDGTRSGRGKQAYFTSSWRLADDMQEIALKLGFVGSVRSMDRRGRRNRKGVTRHIEYRVNIKESYKTEELSRHQEVDYDGFVYCVTVPNHILYVRRNGCPAWCGNSPEDAWSQQDIQAMESSLTAYRAFGGFAFAAAGDNNSGDGETGDHADYPSASPNCIGCGGTNYTPQLESVWNDGQGDGTGGGFSSLFPRPAYQQHIPFSARPTLRNLHLFNARMAGMRMVPDVAGDADPNTGYKILLNGQWGIIGGTSAVAPLWAGFMGAMLASGKVTLTPDQMLTLFFQREDLFNDITVGNNGSYKAGIGPDPCTGCGSPKGAAIFAALSGGTAPPPPPPPPPPTTGKRQAVEQCVAGTLQAANTILKRWEMNQASNQMEGWMNQNGW